MFRRRHRHRQRRPNPPSPETAVGKSRHRGRTQRRRRHRRIPLPRRSASENRTQRRYHLRRQHRTEDAGGTSRWVDVASNVSTTNNLDMKLRLIFLALTIVVGASFAAAQAQRGTLVHEESIRVSPSADAAKLGEAGRGHELVIIETGHDWTHVEAILREPRKDADEDDPAAEGKTITGWVSSKALVNLTTPNGDKIVFGEAADSEDQASRRRGRRDAAQDAMRLYYRV